MIRLHRPAFTVSFTVENSGSVFGGEVRCWLLTSIFIYLERNDFQHKIPQLYVNFPASAGEPPSVLKGFTNTELSPGDKNCVNITLSLYDLSIWDVVQQGWKKPQGQIGITVGASSRDARLKGYLPSSY